MTKKWGIYIQMSQQELESYKQMKKTDKRSDREILLSGAGLPAIKKKRGRPAWREESPTT